MSTTSLKSKKLHVNLTLRKDLYGVAQGYAEASGVSVSAFIERYLASLAKLESDQAQPSGLDPGLEALRGILPGPDAGWSKQEVRAARHEARVNKGCE